MSTADVGILGRTYREAVQWREKLSPLLPDLEGARLLSTYAYPASYGLRVRRLYVAPGADKGYEYRRVLLTHRRNLAKTVESDHDVIVLRDRPTQTPGVTSATGSTDQEGNN